jgi:hypothetical protein
LSEYGVPDDDMPDSLPPDRGPDPYDGWDPEGLLSGESVWLPDGMRPVAGTLAALRAAPMRAELAGEASARAAFREIMLAGERGPGWSGRGVGDGHTLILPTRPAGGGPHPVTRPRHSHRRPPRRGRWQSKALAGAAVGAAVMIVGGIALAGGFSGAAAHPGQPGPSSGATSGTAQAGGTGSGSRGLEGTATKEPTARPTPSASGGQPSSSGSGGTLCRQYWAFFQHPESPASWAAEQYNLQQLSELAGSRWNVPRYCVAYYSWGFAPPAPALNSGNGQGGPGLQVPGDSQGGDQPRSGNGNLGNGGPGNGDGPNGDNSGPGN